MYIVTVRKKKNTIQRYFYIYKYVQKYIDHNIYKDNALSDNF